MILIADSGSTKTDWRLVKKGCKTLSFETIGFNPYFIDSNEVINELNNSELVAIKNKVSQVFFYAAGCSSEKNKNIINTPLSIFFENAIVEVEHDMLAAARATCFNERGMVAILGTGSNSCLYDGKKIIENVPALGFILGDYGSGADIGKTFLKSYLNNELPKDIEEAFNKQFNYTTSQILGKIYNKPLPNRFLASFSLFVFQHITNPFINKMVESRFNLFFEKNICKYQNYKNQELHFIGSVAFIYQDIIKKIATNHQLKINQIIKKPIEKLVEYHLL
jgi:N-acetylglucosamine kinase-like BadF-type ATPase